MAERQTTKTIVFSTILFFVIFFALYSIYYWAEPYLQYYFSWLASSVCFAVGLFDSAVECRNNVIYYANEASLRVIEGCDGITVFILIFAAVLAFPKPLRERFIGVAVLIPILFILNWVRLFILSAVRFYTPDYFDFVHVYLFQPVMVFATFICFIAWILHNENKHRAV